MSEPNFKPEADKLGSLLREARTTPSLPPRFQENVWRRIETAGKHGATLNAGNWLDNISGWLLRPRLAVAIAAVLILAGLGLGWDRGEQLARQDAQARYVAVVAPNALR